VLRQTGNTEPRVTWGFERLAGPERDWARQIDPCPVPELSIATEQGQPKIELRLRQRHLVFHSSSPPPSRLQLTSQTGEHATGAAMSRCFYDIDPAGEVLCTYTDGGEKEKLKSVSPPQ